MVIRIKSAVLGALCLITCFQIWGQAAGDSRLKSTFIYNSLQFVEWPPEALPSPDSRIVIGILGKDPFGPEIDHAFHNKKIKGHDLSVRRLHDMDEIRSCHVLFISRSEQERLPQIFQQIGDRSVFSVSDMEGFAGRGGVLGLIHEKDKLKCEINVAVVKRSRLRVSSKLLRLARIVGGKGH